jgi:hypothetical protein
VISGQPAPAPYPYDPNDGVHNTSATYGPGASTATATSIPAGGVRDLYGDTNPAAVPLSQYVDPIHH